MSQELIGGARITDDTGREVIIERFLDPRPSGVMDRVLVEVPEGTRTLSFTWYEAHCLISMIRFQVEMLRSERVFEMARQAGYVPIPVGTVERLVKDGQL